MSKSFTGLALTAVLFAAGCASQAEFLNNHQSSATQTAVARAQFEMNCQQVTPVIVRNLGMAVLPLAPADSTIGNRRYRSKKVEKRAAASTAHGSSSPPREERRGA
jgi:hypothetical protein